VSSKVDSISLVVDGFGNASHEIVRFKYDRSDFGSSQEFVSRGQSGGTRTNDNSSFGSHNPSWDLGNQVCLFLPKCKVTMYASSRLPFLTADVNVQLSQDKKFGHVANF
jgi:hypothetical protein